MGKEAEKTEDTNFMNYLKGHLQTTFVLICTIRVTSLLIIRVNS